MNGTHGLIFAPFLMAVLVVAWWPQIMDRVRAFVSWKPDSAPPEPTRRRAPMPWEADPAPAVPPSPLPAYDPQGTCAKCGSTDASSAYRAYSPDFKFLPPVPGPGRRRWSYEHMERRCLRCGYVWAEATVSETSKTQAPRPPKVPYCRTCKVVGPYQTVTSHFPVVTRINLLTGKDECAGCGGKYAFVAESEINPAGGAR